jgi:hypothetical protein
MGTAERRMRRCSSVAAAATDMPAATVPASSARMGLCKRRRRHQYGSQDSNRETHSFTHDCIISVNRRPEAPRHMFLTFRP